MATHHIVSVSGGKDSTATLLLARAMDVENLRGVFADTGHEHPITYEFVRYLEQATQIPIRWVSADFSAQIARKRRYIDTHWRAEGIADAVVRAALDVLQPTGIAFLDLCLWKGIFPSRQRRFCTDELKRNPIFEQALLPLMTGSDQVLSWQGVRRDESPARRYLPECEDLGGGLFNYRPILKWSVDAVFEAHRYCGIRPNPLYAQGMHRVGCMPCMQCCKDELAQIARRFPDEVARVREWEHLVSLASKRGAATFFTVTRDPSVRFDALINHTTHGIDRMTQWAVTSHGGRHYQFDFDDSVSTPCSSIYGLCE